MSVDGVLDDCPPGNPGRVLDSVLETFKETDKGLSETDAVESKAVVVEVESAREMVSTDPGLETVACVLEAGSCDDGSPPPLPDAVDVDEDSPCETEDPRSGTLDTIELNTLEGDALLK